MTQFKRGDAIEFIAKDEVGGRDVFSGQRATYDDSGDYPGSVPMVRLPDGHRGAAYRDRFKLVEEPETEEVSVHSTRTLRVGDVVVKPETDDAWPRVRRAKTTAPRRNTLPTAEGSVVKFETWRHAVLLAKRTGGLEWTFVSGDPVKNVFDPFTTDNEFEVKYDAGKTGI